MPVFCDRINHFEYIVEYIAPDCWPTVLTTKTFQKLIWKKALFVDYFANVDSKTEVHKLLMKPVINQLQNQQNDLLLEIKQVDKKI